MNFNTENMPFFVLGRNFEILECKNNADTLFPTFLNDNFFNNIFSEYDFESIEYPVILNISSIISVPAHFILSPINSNSISCTPIKSLSNNQDENIPMQINLREPITSLFALFPMLVNSVNTVNTEKSMDIISNMQKQSYLMLKNVGNISLASRILNGEIFNTQNIDISQLFDSVVNSIINIMPNISLSLDKDDHILINNNKNLFTQALLSVISNSIKYKGDNNLKIDIALKQLKNRCIITYSDNSIGIKPEFIDKVFAPYYSKDPYGDNEFPTGLGIGLFITKFAVGLSKGTILLTSNYGDGVRYSISLPITEDCDNFLSSKPSDYLLDRYSDVFIQLCEYCNLPNV